MTVDYTRRDRLRTAALGGAALAVGASAFPSTAQTPARRPNIVFILADDMGYADVSCYGRRDLLTPNIDRIAAQGTKFTQAYANSPVCTPSRVAIITGRYQIRLPVGLEEPISPSTQRGIGLPPEHPTLPSLLRKEGYGTTLIGKWHLGALPTFSPLKSGYDHFYGCRGGAIDYFLHTGRTGAPDLWEEDKQVSQEGYGTDLFGDRAVKVIGDYARAGQSFLLSLHFNAPHWPWEGPGPPPLRSDGAAGSSRRADRPRPALCRRRREESAASPCSRSPVHWRGQPGRARSTAPSDARRVCRVVASNQVRHHCRTPRYLSRYDISFGG
jgi:arylsulfatase A-like enzyme